MSNSCGRMTGSHPCSKDEEIPWMTLLVDVKWDQTCTGQFSPVHELQMLREGEHLWTMTSHTARR